MTKPAQIECAAEVVAIDPTHYDGLLHKVPFTVGPDFAAKWEAYRADGFTVAHGERHDATGHFLACKIQPGDPIPPLAA